MQEKHDELEDNLIDDEALFVVEDEDDNIEHQETDDSKDDNASALFEVLQEKGLFAEGEEFNGSWDELETKFNELPERVISSIISRHEEPVQKLLTFAITKEKVTADDLAEFISLIKPSEKSYDFSDSDDARDYLRKILLEDGDDEDDIEETLDKWEQKDKLQAKAEQYYSKENQAKQKELDAKIAEAENEKQANAQKYEKIVNDITEQVEKSTYSPAMKKVIFENLDSRTLAQKNNAVMQSPKALIQLASFYSVFDSKTGEFNLEAFKKQMLSKEIQETKKTQLRDKFNSSSISKSKSVEDMDDSRDWVPVLD